MLYGLGVYGNETYHFQFADNWTISVNNGTNDEGNAAWNMKLSSDTPLGR